jgi:protein gp37
MADHSNIEWTEATWNPIVGCSILSPGCTNCYAMKMAARIEKMHPGTHYAGTTKPSKAGPVWTGKLALAPAHILTQPLRWKKPRTIFVNSMGDLFHEDVPDEWIVEVFTIMAIADHHTFQVLTKRPDRARDFLEPSDRLEDLYANWHTYSGGAAEVYSWPLHNVWIGASAEDQQRYDQRRRYLEETPAAKRFWSIEPMLGPIDMNIRFVKPDWVIVGGESGAEARPMHPDWARSIRDQCDGAGVPFFFKQWGNYLTAGQLMADGRPWSPASGNRLHAQKSLAGRFLDGVEHNAMPVPKEIRFG